MNKDRWEKDADARRWRRCIDDRRRWDINSFAVAIRPIKAFAVAVSVILPPSVVTVVHTLAWLVAVVMFTHPFMIIFAEGRHYVYTADHSGQDKPHHDLAHYRSKIPCA